MEEADGGLRAMVVSFCCLRASFFVLLRGWLCLRASEYWPSGNTNFFFSAGRMSWRRRIILIIPNRVIVVLRLALLDFLCFFQLRGCVIHPNLRSHRCPSTKNQQHHTTALPPPIYRQCLFPRPPTTPRKPWLPTRQTPLLAPPPPTTTLPSPAHQQRGSKPSRTSTR